MIDLTEEQLNKVEALVNDAISAGGYHKLAFFLGAQLGSLVIRIGMIVGRENLDIVLQEFVEYVHQANKIDALHEAFRMSYDVTVDMLDVPMVSE